jgi:hypothetical protein
LSEIIKRSSPGIGFWIYVENEVTPQSIIIFSVGG